tara:strand:- start:822 stop:1034 length:213 start_codon:yes stop_codon:yes gene_type:complete
MISLSATILLVSLALATDTILEIGSEITAATINDADMGVKLEEARSLPTKIVDLSPVAALQWSRPDGISN